MSKFGIISVTLLVAFLSLGIYAAFQEQKDWEQFAKDHECKLITHVAPRTYYGFRSDGTQGTVTEPEKKAFLCNDGVTYWR